MPATCYLTSSSMNSAESSHKIVQLLTLNFNVLKQQKLPSAIFARNVVPLTKARIAFKIALLLLIITLEGAINAGLFATNMDGGLLSGFGIALLASALNAGVSFAFGLFLIPYINHKNALLKLGGWIAFACWIAITVVIAFAIAHYRDALQAGDTFEATKVAWTTFSEAPFTLTDFLSWLLWALTLFMGSCAAADGYTFRDPYPGYSKENTKYEEAKKGGISSSQDYKLDLAISARNTSSRLMSWLQKPVMKLLASKIMRKLSRKPCWNLTTPAITL